MKDKWVAGHYRQLSFVALYELQEDDTYKRVATFHCAQNHDDFEATLKLARKIADTGNTLGFGDPKELKGIRPDVSRPKTAFELYQNGPEKIEKGFPNPEQVDTAVAEGRIEEDRA